MRVSTHSDIKKATRELEFINLKWIENVAESAGILVI